MSNRPKPGNKKFPKFRRAVSHQASITGSKDRHLAGKKRIRARKAANRAEREASAD